MAESLSINEVNELSATRFVSVFDNVVERCPVIAAAVSHKRPFASRDALFGEISACVDGMSTDLKRGILLCHPDLAGKLATEGQLTAESTSEQSKAGLLNLPAEEFHRLNSFNDEYFAKFQFPFVICVGENKKQAIFEGIERRLKNSPQEELNIGIEQVKRIASIRLNNLVNSANSAHL